MKLALTGDVMLGRLVNQHVVEDLSLPPAAAWGDTLPLFHSADLRLINLECVISSKGEKWRPLSKPFHFRAHPRALEILRAARIDAVTIANNHVLDYGYEALKECLTLLDQAGIPHTGAGLHAKDARNPIYVPTPQGRLAVVALTDNEPEWEAADTTPGVHYVSYTSSGLHPRYRTQIVELLTQAKRQAPFVVVSAHVGPNWGEPSLALQALAHELLTLGADCFWGHSNHTPQGIEIFKGKPILYSTGDFLDDYALDPRERNDLSFLFIVDIEGGQAISIHLHPVRIVNCRVRRAKGGEVSFLHASIRAKCAKFGTDIAFKEAVGTIMIH